MITFYWNCITGLEFWIIREPINYKSKKKKRTKAQNVFIFFTRQLVFVLGKINGCRKKATA